MLPGAYINPGHYGPARPERTVRLKGSPSLPSALFDTFRWTPSPPKWGCERPLWQRLGGEGVGEVTLFNQRVPLPTWFGRKVLWLWDAAGMEYAASKVWVGLRLGRRAEPGGLRREQAGVLVTH